MFKLNLNKSDRVAILGVLAIIGIMYMLALVKSRRSGYQATPIVIKAKSEKSIFDLEHKANSSSRSSSSFLSYPPFFLSSPNGKGEQTLSSCRPRCADAGWSLPWSRWAKHRFGRGRKKKRAFKKKRKKKEATSSRASCSLPPPLHRLVPPSFCSFDKSNRSVLVSSMPGRKDRVYGCVKGPVSEASARSKSAPPTRER